MPKPCSDWLTALLVSATALTGCATAEGPTEPSLITSLQGRILDTNNQPVVGAEVVVVIGDEPVTETFRTDESGHYAVRGVPSEQVIAAYYRGREVSLLIYSPAEDRAPLGTAEGDRIHLTPLSLNEFVEDLSLLAVNDSVPLRDGFVPLQAAGYEITPELVANGGELTWSFADSPIGGRLDVSLVIEPGSIQMVPGAQTEITLTPIERSKAPMQIPSDGTGIIWTIQPRDVVFDPPAKVRVSGQRMSLLGLANPEPGSVFEVFGASLEAGWQLFGPVKVVELDGDRVTLESTEGIISKGAWGHVFSGINVDAGVLISCFDSVSRQPIPCILFDDNWDRTGDGLDDQIGWVSLNQLDYQNQHRTFYYTDREPVCSGCTNNGHPEAQLAVGLNMCAQDPQCDPMGTAPISGIAHVWLLALRLDCFPFAGNETTAERDIIAMDYLNAGSMPAAQWMDLARASSASASVEFGVSYRNFSYQANFYLDACP